MNEFNNIVRTLRSSGRLKKIYGISLAFLAVLVAFLVWIIMIRPAESKSGTVTCELEEHVHTEECYSYICGYDSSSEGVSDDSLNEGNAEGTVHVHTADCLAVICGITEHTHSASCVDPLGSHHDNSIQILERPFTTDNSEDEYDVDTDTDAEDGIDADADAGTDLDADSGIIADNDMGETETDTETETETETDIDTDDAVSGDGTDDNLSELTEEESAEMENLPDKGNLTEAEFLELIRKRMGLGLLKTNPLKEMALVTPQSGKTYRIKCKNKAGNDIGYMFYDSGDGNVHVKNDDGTVFHLVSASDDYFYIKPANEPDKAFQWEKTADDTALLKLADYDNSKADQKFIFYSRDDGTCEIQVYSDGQSHKLKSGIKEFMDVSSSDLNTYTIGFYYRKSTSDNNNKDDKNQFFTLEEYTQPSPSPSPTNGNLASPPSSNGSPAFTLEARIIFGDYNDGKVERNDRYVYDGLAEQLKLSLNYRWGDEERQLSEFKNVTPVVDSSAARKDWCYQYNYTWTGLNPYDDMPGKTNPGYFVKLGGTHGVTGVSNQQAITINGREFNVYYINPKDNSSNSSNIENLGENNYTGKNNGGTQVMFPVSPKHAFLNEEGVIYIFLDPVADWSWGDKDKNGTIGIEDKPETFDLSMKKRWDGHNSAGFNNRPKEKIVVQLQHWDGSKWTKFDDSNYVNKMYYTTKDANGDAVYYDNTKLSPSNPKVIGTDIPEANRVKIEYGGVAQDYVYQKDGVSYFIDKTQLVETTEKNKRLELDIPMQYANDITLDLYGKYNPQHFTNGYYYNWKSLPYGQYRVVEVQSFYDANDNGVCDAGEDTSSEYTYMSYPPSRDSRGVLHLQNFTKNMSIDVTKEWLNEDGTPDNLRNEEITFQIFRTTDAGAKTNPDSYDLEKVSVNSSETFTTSGKYIKITGLAPHDNTGKKYYYFIKETNIDSNYELVNGNGQSIVKNGNVYGADYEDGDARRFIIRNKKKMTQSGLKIEKKWYADKNTEDSNLLSGYNQIKPEFEVYKSHFKGIPGYDSSDGKFRIDYNTPSVGKEEAELVYRGYVADNNMLEIPGLAQYYNHELSYEKYKDNYDENGNPIAGFTDMPYEINGSVSVSTINDTKCFSLQNSIWIKPTCDGELTLIFASDTDAETDIVNFWDKRDNNSVFNETNFSFAQSESGTKDGSEYSFDASNRILTVSLKAGGNYRLVKGTGNSNICPYLLKASFKPRVYYYVREVPAENFETINDGNTQFIQTDGLFYTEITDQNLTPTVTAKNMPVMKIQISKKWYQDYDMDNQVKQSFESKFKLYKAYISTDNPVTGNSEEANVVYVKDITVDKLGIYVIEDLPAYEKDSSGNIRKIYYYIQEQNGNYMLLNEDARNGFVTAGTSGEYGVSFDTANAAYVFNNKPEFKLTVQKNWVNLNNSTDQQNMPQMKFQLLRTSETPEVLKQYTNTNGTIEVTPDEKDKYKYWLTSGGNRVMNKDGTDISFKVVKNGDKDYFTTMNFKQEYTTINGTVDDFVAFNTNRNHLCYYVLEVDGDNNSYMVKDSLLLCENQFSAWAPYGEYPVITIKNKNDDHEAFIMPSTGGPGTTAYKTIGAVISTASLLLLIMSIRRKSGVEINKKQNFMNKG